MYLFARADVNSNWPSELATRRKIVIVSYVKSGDSMTLLFDKEQKQIRSIKIASYHRSLPPAWILRNRQVDLTDGAV